MTFTRFVMIFHPKTRTGHRNNWPLGAALSLTKSLMFNAHRVRNRVHCTNLGYEDVRVGVHAREDGREDGEEEDHPEEAGAPAELVQSLGQRVHR